MVSTLIAASAPLAVVGMPGYAIGWGTLSLINAGLAQSKNHSGLLWWLLSLVLGPIATLLIVLVLDKRDRLVYKNFDDFA